MWRNQSLSSEMASNLSGNGENGGENLNAGGVAMAGGGINDQPVQRRRHHGCGYWRMSGNIIRHHLG